MPVQPSGLTAAWSAAGRNAGDGTIAVELLEQVLPSVQGNITEAAERLQEWLAGTVITPRFRTPLEKRFTSTCIRS